MLAAFWAQFDKCSLELKSARTILIIMASIGSILGFMVLVVVLVGFVTVNFLQTEPKRRLPKILSTNSELLVEDHTEKNGATDLDILNVLESQKFSLDDVKNCMKLWNKTSANDFEENDECPNHQFVMSTFDAGGLGNKMSEYATLLAISTLIGFTPILSVVRKIGKSMSECCSQEKVHDFFGFRNFISSILHILSFELFSLK